MSDSPFENAHKRLLMAAEALKLAAEIGNIPGITETLADKVEGTALPLMEAAKRLQDRLDGRERDVDCLTAIIGRSHLARCPGCDRYILRHEVCLHCAGKAEVIDTFAGRLDAGEIIDRLRWSAARRSNPNED